MLGLLPSGFALLLANVPRRRIDLAAPDLLIFNQAPDVLARVTGLGDKGPLPDTRTVRFIERGGYSQHSFRLCLHVGDRLKQLRHRPIPFHTHMLPRDIGQHHCTASVTLQWPALHGHIHVA